MQTQLPAFAAALILATAIPSLIAQNPTPGVPSADKQNARGERLRKLGAQTEGVGHIGYRAEMDVPPGYVFFPTKGTQQLLKEWGNLVNGNEDGLIMNSEKGWSVCFEFEDVGYVKDDEKDSLDADKMMQQMRDSESGINEARREAGLPTQHMIGFAMPPKYNEQTHNLEWAVKFTVDGEQGENLNYHTKILGRKGVMTATLMCEPSELQSILADYQKTLTGFRFNGGETYAEYRQGDKIATYGLIGLVAGGAAIAAGKAGLFGKLGILIAKGGKLVVVAIVAVFAGIAKFFKRIFGRHESPYRQ